jgi:hypothetical protein
MRDKMGNNNKSAMDNNEEGTAIRKHGQTGKLTANRPVS